MGLTSKYLEDFYQRNLNFDRELISNRIFIKDSTFKLPADPSTPIIMVGPGTGVVPFIGFCQEREIMLQNDPTLKLGEAFLFFGCRKSTSNFIYQEDFAFHKAKHHLTDAFFAFSREDGQKKVYVQDLLKQQRDLIADVLINRKGYFYICGNTRMGQDIQNLLKEFIGQEQFTAMDTEKRLIKELWG